MPPFRERSNGLKNSKSSCSSKLVDLALGPVVFRTRIELALNVHLHWRLKFAVILPVHVQCRALLVVGKLVIVHYNLNEIYTKITTQSKKNKSINQSAIAQ